MCMCDSIHTFPLTSTTHHHHLAYLARDTLILQPPENLQVARPCISAVKPNPFMNEKDTSMSSHERGGGGGSNWNKTPHKRKGGGVEGGATILTASILLALGSAASAPIA